MAIKTRKTCVIISQSSLLSEFINNLDAKQWSIEAVISDVYSRIRSINTEIDCNPLETCVEKILAIKPDYVFSIVNPVILPKIILTKSICINFHPSLLPHYRGVCPTNWAIYHHEKIHGYTWHVMSLKIDQGAIFFQAKVPVLKEDTAKTLMLRCYKKAIEDFPQLLRILLVGPSNTTMGESKQIKQAKYYSYGNKPNFLLTDLADYRFSDRLLRAATAIDSYNDFGVVKVYIDDQFYILNSLKNQQDSYCRENDSVIVYDNKRYVAELTSLDGNPVIVQSAHLSSLPDKLIKQYLSYCNQVASKEQYWLKLLRNFRSPKLFSYINHSNQSHAGNYHFQCDFLHHCQLNYSPDQIIFALWCAIIAKITDADKVSLWVRHDFKIEEVLQPLFYDYVPLDLLTDQNQTLQQYIDNIIGIKQKASLKHCFATDLFARDSLLKERGALPSFSFVISDNTAAIKCDDNHPVIFAYNCTNNTMDVCYYLPQNSFLTKALAYFKEYFTLLLAYDVNTKLSKVSLNQAKPPQPINTHEFLKKNPKYRNRINQLVRKNAKAAPNHIILEQGDKKYTYKVLLQDFSLTSNRLASYIQPSTIIGLVLPRGYVFIKYMLAILERQAAYFPILYDMKTAVMLDLMIDIGTYAFISDREVTDSRVDTKIKINDQIWFYKLKAVSNPSQLSPATAYVMFTSGSTGKPKAIPIKHVNIINLCEDQWVQKLSHHKKIMHASQVSFDGSTFEIWSALLNIGTICVLENLSLITDIKVMSLFLKQHQIETVILSTKILETEWVSSTIDLTSIQYLMFVGESCQLNILKKFSKQHTHIELLNGYGPAENTACSSLCLFDNKTYMNDYPNIGYPLDNIIANIYDSHFNLMPYYIPGRLFLSGLSLFDGYLNAPNTSLINYQGAQQYNSGDICYLDADNALYIIGRDDKMIKLHGYRIELKHLEQVLSFNTQVISAKAEIIANQFNQPSLVAFIIEKGLNRHSYEKEIGEKLPAYMCPKCYIYLKKWPLTHHGKLDKKALLQTFKKYLQDRNLGIHGESKDVNTVIGLFRAILNVDNVDQHDDFFKLGGDSLRLIALKAQVKALFNVELLLQYFLDQPTPYGLYQLIHSNTENSDMPRQQNFEQSISEYCQKINTLTIATQANFSDDQDFILLTGASGFVGGQTLFFLCQQGYQVYCLLRPENGSIAEKKRQIIKQCLDNTKDPGNIVFLSGDFAKEKLGLSDRNYNTLCHKITAIIHCGCHVNHLYHYKQLALDNVFSTYSLIKLASQGLQKRIIYVSSLSAVLPKDIGSSIAEKIYPDRGELNLVNGYSQSKYASEVLLNHAAKKGLDCIIVRPSWVVGHSQTGYFPNKSDHYSLIIRSVLSSCFAPEIDFNFHFIPVDVLAELLVDSVAINRQSGPYIINAKLPQAIAWRRLLRHLNVDNHRIIYNTEKWHHYIIGLDCTSDLFALKLLYETTQHLNLLHKSNIIDIQMANFKLLAKHYKIDLPKVYNTDLIIRLFGSIINSKEKHKIKVVKRISHFFAIFVYRMQLLCKGRKTRIFLGVASLASMLLMTEFSDILTVTIE